MNRLLLTVFLSFPLTPLFAAEWIAAGEPRGSVEATSFVKRLTNEKAVVRAIWRTSGLGVYEAFVNGREVGGFLKPGYTHVKKCRHVYAFDVTDKFQTAASARNVLSATVTSGWYRDGIIVPMKFDWLPFEDEQGLPESDSDSFADAHKPIMSKDADNAFWGELELVYADGSTARFGTDESWRASRAGCVRDASIYGGETYDARVDESWRLTGEVAWPQAKRDAQFAGEMRPAAGEIRLREDLTLTPKTLTVLGPAFGVTGENWGVARVRGEYEEGDAILLKPGDELVADFGQNTAGVVEMDLEGEAGAVVTVRHAEMLNEGAGNKSRGNDGPEGTPYVANLRSAKASVTYTLKAGRQTFLPRHSFFGYRYAGLRTTKPVKIHRLRSVPVSSLAPEQETASIETGRAELNRLISNVNWSFLSNYLSVPMDCPQRDERCGWTGDAQVFVSTALYLADVEGFLRKWMDDMRDSQFPDGGFRSAAPPGRCGLSDACAGYGDAGIIVPYRVWRRTGDLAIVRENWLAMTRHFALLEAKKGPPVSMYGDWLSYESNDVHIKSFVTAVYWLIDARLLGEMAEALGQTAEAAHYRQRAEEILGEVRTRFCDPKTGILVEPYVTQTTEAYALGLGLVEGAAREATRAALVRNIRNHGNRLQTGFLGTPVLLDVLSDIGEHELAVTLLLQHDEPSWLYPIDQGATTVWERWGSYTKAKGFGPVGMNSFNHYSFGAVVGWMYSSLAGIRESPKAAGMRRFILAPRPDRRLGRITARYRSRAGLIESAWSYAANGDWTWRYTVPTGATADVTLPDGRTFERTAGSYEERIPAPRVTDENRLKPIGGLTKPIVATLVLKLAAEGKVDLDKPISTWLGDARFSMTLRQALSCTGGFAKGHPCYPADTFTMDEILKTMCRKWPAKGQNDPDFVYGPWGYYAAAAVVEKVTGESFDAALRRIVLGPLGMSDTVFVPNGDQMSRLAPSGETLDWLTMPFDAPMRRAVPDCGLFSTDADLKKFKAFLESDPIAAPFFEKQTPATCSRAFSFGFNVLAPGRISFTSATGVSISVTRK